MSTSLVFLIVVAIGVVGYFLGRQRALSKDSGSVKPHSLPHYHGWWVFLASALPAILFLAVWAAATSLYLERTAIAELPERTADTVIASQSLELGMVSGIARGLNKLSSEEKANLPQTLVAPNCVRFSRQRALRSRRTVRII